MEVLIRQALELIEAEKIKFADEWAVLKRESAHFLMARDALRGEVAACEEKITHARNPLSKEETEGRRYAELDSRHRPAELVRARRRAAWQRRLLEAEQQHQAAVTRLAQADREFELRGELIRDRAAVARAAARRHHELALRRVATYLQVLVRRHRQGTELNTLLVQFPTGPDLPSWTREPDEGQDGIEQMFALGSGPLTSDRYLSQ
jgi:hypothetical protein